MHPEKILEHSEPSIHGIVRRISARINPVKIFLFGSRAKGEAKQGSDFDFVIIYDGEESKRDVKSAVYRIFRGERLSLDVLVLSSEEFNRFKHVANTIAREISENGKLVFG